MISRSVKSAGSDLQSFMAIIIHKLNVIPKKSYNLNMNIFFSILAGIGFGITMFLRKLSVSEIGVAGFIFEAIVEAILALLLVYFLFPFNLGQLLSKPNGIWYGIAGGISISVGVIAFFLATKYGPALTPSVIGPLLSAITASLLAIIFLHESISPVRLTGLIIALAGIFVFLKF